MGRSPRDVGLQTLENKALSWGVIGKSAPILAEIIIRKSQEIVLAYLLLELSTAKLVKFFPYAGSKEGRLMESLQGRYLKSLKMFQKLNGRHPSMALNVTQINVET